MTQTTVSTLTQRPANGKRNGNGVAYQPNGLTRQGSDPTESTRKIVQQLFAGTLPDSSVDFESFGTWRVIVESLVEQYNIAGRDGVQKALNGIVNTSPELANIFIWSEPNQLSTHPWEPQVFTLKDAYKPRPPLQYAVQGLFPFPSLSIVYGAPGTLKSMLLTDLAICVSEGLPWLEPLPNSADTGTIRKTMKSPVLWVDFDNGPRKLHERMGALARARKLTTDAPISYVSMPYPWLDASLAQQTEELGEYAKQCGIKLLIIDNLTTITGQVDENSAAMGGVMSNLRMLAEDTQAAVVIIHHQKKGSSDKGHAGDQLRGSSSINASVDLALKVERDHQTNIVTVESTKTRGTDVWPFKAQFVFDLKPDKELDIAQFHGLTVANNNSNSDHAVKQTIIEIVKANGPFNTKEALKDRVKEALALIGKNRIADCIEELVAEGKLCMTVVKGTKQYSIPK